MSKPETRDRLALIREALRILDGEAPEELVVEGDGWSLLDPESVSRGDGAPTTVAEVPLPPSRPPTSSRSVSSLLGAMHDALDAAMSEGWTLEVEQRPHAGVTWAMDAVDEGWALDEEPETSTSAHMAVVPEPPAVDDSTAATEVDESAQERAFFEAGDAMATAPLAGRADEYEDNSPAFWRRFWAKSA